MDSITLNVLSFEVIPDRPNGIRNVTFFGTETIDSLLSFPATHISSVELIVEFGDVVESN